jgi:DNA primase
MDPNARAKYLNGPETTLFDKGRNLFNHGPAREAAGKGQPLIVAEGYMDVIALVEAGFKSAVAPLGTAVTEDQLKLMWRIHDEPIIALDGDKAGIAAALRVVDLALPLLESGKGLRFAILPTGLDPDDLIKAQGAAAMQKVLDDAQPMVTLLWRRETEGRSFDSPERKASLDKTLRAALTRITDPSIRSHYGEEIKRLRLDLFGTRARQNWQPQRKGRFTEAPQNALAATKGSLLATAPDRIDEVLREAVILATLINHPTLIPRFESALERIDLTGDGHAAIRDILLSHMDPTTVEDRLRRAAPAALDALMSRPHVLIAPPVRNRADADLATLCLAEELAKLDARRGARREIDDAIEDLTGIADEGLTWRLSQASAARHRADHPPRADAAELGEDRAAMSNHLQSLINSKVWEKKKH